MATASANRLAWRQPGVEEQRPSQGEGERAVEQGAAKVDANGSCKGVRRRRNGSGKGVLLAVHGYGEHKATR